jgi:hypothetical protein
VHHILKLDSWQDLIDPQKSINHPEDRIREVLDRRNDEPTDGKTFTARRLNDDSYGLDEQP